MHKEDAKPANRTTPPEDQRSKAGAAYRWGKHLRLSHKAQIHPKCLQLIRFTRLH
jgi:hypothetical protein